MAMSAEMTGRVSTNHVPQVAVKWSSNVPGMLLMLIAILLPLITLDTNTKSGGIDLISRLQPVDIMTVLWVVIFLPQKTLRIHPAGMLYAFALVVSLSIGVFFSDSSELSPVFVAFLALAMAFVYWLLGYNAGQSRSLTTILLYGLFISICWEAIIALHDYFASSPWFADNYPGRVRGTFHKNGQLGAFGFSSAGLLLTMGWALSSRRWWRRLTVLGAGLSVFFIWAAARRSGLIAIAVWGLLIAIVLIARSFKSKGLLLLILLGAFALPIAALSINLGNSVTGREMASGLEDLQQDNAFFEIQFREYMVFADKWFPFGLGTGRAQMLDAGYGETASEIHNGHLALLVEIGVLGLLAFYWMAMLPIFQQWDAGGHPQARVVRALVISFIIAAAIFAVHNRLHRDRVFMLFLGLATTFPQTLDRERNLQR